MVGGLNKTLSDSRFLTTEYYTSLPKSIFNEIIHGPGTKHLIKVLASPIGLLGTFFLIISIFLGFLNNSQALTLTNILWYVFFYIALAESWNIIGGYAGEIDFGHVLFAGVGMYTEGILITQYHIFNYFQFPEFAQIPIINVLLTFVLPLVISIFISGLIAVIFALIIGVPVLKLRGSYFAIAMLAFSQTLLILYGIDNLLWFYDTNGGNGIYVGSLLHLSPIINPQLYSAIIYLLIIAVSIVAFIISHYVSYTRLGLALRAIKGSPDGASSIGINVLKTKLEAFAISAFIAGLAGGVYILSVFDVTPDVAFNVQTTVQMIIMTLLGGPASVFGPVIGALIIWPIRTLLNNALSTVSLNILGIPVNFSTAYLIIYGLIFVLAVLFLPKGIIGYLEDKGIIPRESLIVDEQLDKFKNGGVVKDE